MARLKKLAVAVCILQFLITIGVPLMQFFLVFNMSVQHMHVLIVTGVSALIVTALGLASALTHGATLPALHVVAAILLAALMGSFNTQTYLDLNMQCNVAQAAISGCTTCTCAATSSCTELLLKDAACSSCKALGTDLCARVRWQVLLMPYTGLIEAVLLAVPAFLSLLLLLQRSNGLVAAGDFGKGGDVKVMVNAWPGHGASEPEDWPSTNPVAAAPAQRAPSSKHTAAVEQPWQQGADNMVSELNGAGEPSGYLTTSSYGTSVEAETGVGKKKAPGLKKKLKSTVSAARAEAALG